MNRKDGLETLTSRIRNPEINHQETMEAEFGASHVGRHAPTTRAMLAGALNPSAWVKCIHGNNRVELLLTPARMHSCRSEIWHQKLRSVSEGLNEAEAGDQSKKPQALGN